VKARAGTKICKRCGKARALRMFASPKARVCNPCKRSNNRRASRALRVKQTYGITLVEYDAILKAQDGKCAGCGGVRPYNLHVDHDHRLEAFYVEQGASPQEAARLSVRGLLCARCNKVLRDVRDGGETLRRLADYLDDPPARKVLAA
jgi:hypothetical protein